MSLEIIYQILYVQQKKATFSPMRGKTCDCKINLPGEALIEGFS
jgi:hypothetical protein